MMRVVLFSAAAGICGTGLGALASVFLFRRRSENMTCWMLSFAAGVMTSIVFFGLLPEAFGLAGAPVAIFGLTLGVIIIMLLNRVVDKITGAKEGDLQVHHTPEELYHESMIIQAPQRMLRSGLIMLAAIALHNLPEGIAIGAGGVHDNHMGVLLAVMLGLHNIPEGMAIAAPMLAGGVGRGKAVLLTALSGAPMLLGGLIGMMIGSISDAAVALSLSIAGGAMLYVVFGEIMPQSIVMTKNRTASIVTLSGIIIGLVLTQLQV